MKILLSGSSGLIGTELQKILKEKGHDIVRLVRQKPDGDLSDYILWDPEKFPVNITVFEDFDAVIHLAGENIAGGRWNEDRKKKIQDSRIKSTYLLSQILNKLSHKPSVFICASAVGYYGDCGNIACDEDSPNGKGFLAEVCQQWEDATYPAILAGIRTINLRFGVILSPKGGALAKMIPPFKLGLGGVLGSGNQYMSWIAIDDVIGIIQYAIDNSTLVGPINVVAPNPVTNRQFTKTLGEVLERPTFIPVPTFALHLLLGREMADEILLSSTRALPSRLQKSKYTFIYPDLQEALYELLNRK